MSDSEDSFAYENYGLQFYEDETEEGPPLIKKKSRLIAAVVQDQVEILQELLDSPRWYNVRDRWGYSLLQIAILRNNVAVFDYLLSVPQFPLEFVNKYDQTAVKLAILGKFVSNGQRMKEHFAYELVKKGANVDHDSLMLHYALERGYYRVATLLIEKGFDVNYRGICAYAPLQHAVMDYGNLEVVMALLMYGAEPSIDLFHESILSNLPIVIAETMYLLLFDEHSKTEITWDALVRLTQRNLPLLDEMLKHPIEITNYPDEIGTFIMTCLSIKTDSLRRILPKLSLQLNEAASLLIPSSDLCITPEHLENLEVMLESDLRPTMMSFITDLDTRGLFSQLVQKYNESEVIETYCYLLSYGLPLRECDLSRVYKKFGHGETFKIFLHMDVPFKVDHKNRPSYWVWPYFLHSAGMDLEQILRNQKNCRVLAMFLRYFRDPRVVNIINSKIGTRHPCQQKGTLKVPLLLELARNAFHKFVTKTCNVTTSRGFYTLVNCLDINSVYKKIITYETNLY